MGAGDRVYARTCQGGTGPLPSRQGGTGPLPSRRAADCELVLEWLGVSWSARVARTINNSEIRDFIFLSCVPKWNSRTPLKVEKKGWQTAVESPAAQFSKQEVVMCPA